MGSRHWRAVATSQAASFGGVSSRRCFDSSGRWWKVCALLVKEGAMKVSQDIRYVGFEIPNSFVVGYGLDVAERYRNLDAIYAFVGEDVG